jgi:GT2 family glycosyltransferase
MADFPHVLDELAAPPGIRLSIVMPAFNAAATIAEAIRSILNQSHTGLEILVIDDCSRDATAAIVDEYAAADPRVRLIRRAENSGASACMNAGVKLASHDWIAIFDADAVAPPDWLERAAAIATAAGPAGYDAFGGGCDYFPPATAFERVAFAFEADDTATRAETFGPENPREPTIRGTNFFFTRACFDRVGGFAEDIRAAYDRLFLCNAIERGCRVRFDPTLRVGHPLPGSTVGEFLRRKTAIERWRLVAAERSPILRQVYRPIWPVIMAVAIAAAGLIWLAGPWQAVLMGAAGVGVAVGLLSFKGLSRGLSPPTAIEYAAIDICKKSCTAAIFLFRLRPATADWKARLDGCRQQPG